MHIVDGAVTAPVLAVGATVGLVGTAIGLRTLTAEKLPQAALIAAVFFVASMIHFPIGPTSVHLILGGLAGLVLGWAAFPAFLVVLILQAVLFGYGGIAILGVNLVNLAVPAVLVHYAFRGAVRSAGPRGAAIWGGLAAAVAMMLAAGMVGLSLAASGEAFHTAAKVQFVGHLPVMVVEAFLTAAVVALVRRVKPELLDVFVPRALARPV